MKKKMLPLFGGAVLLVALLGIYAVKSGRNTTTTPDTEPTSASEQVSTVNMINQGQYTLCDKQAEEISDIQITSANGSLSLKYNGGNIICEGYEAVSLNMSNAASVASNFIGLYSDNRIDGDESKYGLENPTAVGVANFTDGSSVTLTLGSLTADKRYYYLKSSELEGIYLVDAVVGERLLYTINDLADKTISVIKPNYINYIEVINANGKHLLMYYDKEKSNSAKNLADKGLATLTMESPINGAAVYPYNLSGTILSTCGNITLNSVVDANPQDYSLYGLDEPKMTVRLRDGDGALELKVGNDADDENVYAMADSRISVFTVSKSVLKPFESYVVTDFIEKFVALKSRTDINGASITGEFGDFTLDFKAGEGNKIDEDEKGNLKDNRLIYINNKEVKNDSFVDFYEALVGLTFDEISEHSQKLGQPKVKLSYTMLDGSREDTEFFEYNENFYAVGRDGEYDMLVDKQRVKQIVDMANALSK